MKNTNNCTKCGKPYTYIGDIPEGGFTKGAEPWCTCSSSIDNPIISLPCVPIDSPTGWICPVCGRGNSPYNGTCPCKGNFKITFNPSHH